MDFVRFNIVIIFSTENEMFPIKVFERGESAITALIGGPLYRGSLFKTLQGHLLYGDYMNG